MEKTVRIKMKINLMEIKMIKEVKIMVMVMVMVMVKMEIMDQRMKTNKTQINQKTI
jgi:hypothetical protein